MTLQDKIVNIVKECGCRPLSYRAQDALVAMIERECAERVRAALGKRVFGGLLGDFAMFLAGKGFEIVDPERVQQEVSCSYRLAKQIFKNRKVLVPFMCKVALEVNCGKPIEYSADSPDAVNVLRNFLNGLKRTGHAVDYSISDGCFVVVVPPDESKRLFFRSEWAEECFRYIISKTMNETAKKFGVRHKIMPNVEIRRKGETSLFTELDVVAQIGSRFYVFEVKSGPRVNVMQWAARERAFVAKNGSLRVIVCTIHDNIPGEIFEPQILLNLENFESRMTHLLTADFSDKE